MKATELMIGDWVIYCWSSKLSYYQGQVKDVWNGGCHIDAYSVKEDNIEPIPLTPEILAKNGLREYMSFHFSTDVCIEGKVNGYELSVPYRGSIYGITSVHELQHALRLCGLDELADNFQI